MEADTGPCPIGPFQFDSSAHPHAKSSGILRPDVLDMATCIRSRDTAQIASVEEDEQVTWSADECFGSGTTNG